MDLLLRYISCPWQFLCFPLRPLPLRTLCILPSKACLFLFCLCICPVCCLFCLVPQALTLLKAFYTLKDYQLSFPSPSLPVDLCFPLSFCSSRAISVPGAASCHRLDWSSRFFFPLFLTTCPTPFFSGTLPCFYGSRLSFFFVFVPNS